MATTVFRNKNIVRPKKRGTAKRQRINVQRRRLVALGVPEAEVEKLNASELRNMLKYPVKTAAAYAK